MMKLLILIEFYNFIISKSFKNKKLTRKFFLLNFCVKIQIHKK